MMAAMAVEVTIRPARAATHRGTPERPAKKSTYEPAGDGTDRTSHYETRARAGGRANQISVGAWRNCHYRGHRCHGKDKAAHDYSEMLRAPATYSQTSTRG
jgi:hypothetical protein